MAGAHRGGRFAAERGYPSDTHPWLVSVKGHATRLAYTDGDIRVIHEIIPED